MDVVYHTSVTGSDTSPFVPPPTVTELLRQYFCAHAVGTLLDVTVQSLAKTIGCSPGRMTPALRQLERHGYIAYLPTPKGSLVEVLKSDRSPDRPPSDDTPPTVDTAMLAPTDSAPTPHESPEAVDRPPDRSETAETGDQTIDRLAIMEDHESHDQQHQPRARESQAELPGLDGAAWVPWAAILRAHPGFTHADLLAADAKVRTRTEYNREQQIRVLFASLLSCQPIYSRSELVARQEAAHGPRTDTGDRRSHRTEPHAGSHDRRGGAGGAAAGHARGRGEKHDKYGAGEAYRDRPTPAQLPPFLRAAAERARMEAGGAGG